MRRRFILASSLFTVLALAQSEPEESAEMVVTQTDVQLVYNQYLQTGDNSAVTGGLGTERLTIYGPAFSLSHQFGNNIIDFDLGVDVISSASTDNIDDVVSSVSRLDARTYTSLGYSRVMDEGRLTLTTGLSGSIESDYTSLGIDLGATRTDASKTATYSAQAQVFLDDLRWGRLQDGFLQAPLQLIYPEELRFQEWYDKYLRYSFNLNLGTTQFIDQRNSFGIFLVLSYQQGLLATPFHRVYFNDGSLAVEQLPSRRFKSALTGQWNTFVGGNIILRNSLNAFVDNFGILAAALENQTVFKLDPRWSLHPSIRFYLQSAADYFAPFGEHDPNQEYYTSDYDLSDFNAFTGGLGLTHRPVGRKNGPLSAVTWQYFYYGRSNQLQAHTLSMVFDFSVR